MSPGVDEFSQRATESDKWAMDYETPDLIDLEVSLFHSENRFGNRDTPSTECIKYVKKDGSEITTIINR